MANEMNMNQQGHETKLREAMNVIKARGILAEKNLGFYESDAFVTKDTTPLPTPPADGGKIAGSVSIEIDGERTLVFKVDVKATTKQGKPNEAYKGLLTVMKEYKSIPEVGREEATRIEVRSAKFNIRGSKRDSRSEVKNYTEYRTMFFSRIPDDEELEPCATYDVEVFINGFQEEYNKEGNKTGNLIVKCWMPMYGGGVEPIELVAEQANGVAAAIQKYYSVGDTVNFQGEINNRCIVDKQEIPMKIGAPKIIEKRTYINSLTITGASEPYNKVPDLRDKAFDKDMVMVAIQERNAAIDERARKKEEADNNMGGMGAQIGGSMFGMNQRPTMGFDVTGKAAAGKRTLPQGW